MVMILLLRLLTLSGRSRVSRRFRRQPRSCRKRQTSCRCPRV